MATFPVDNVGTAGFLPDVEHWKMPANAWTWLENVSVRDDGLLPPYLTQAVFPEAGLPFSSMYISIFVHNNGGVFWYVLCTTDRVYASRGNLIFDITPTTGVFSANINDRWQAEFFNGFLILNNGSDEPHYWPLEPDSGQEVARLRPLSSWPGASPWPQGQSCAFIAGFRNALLAGNIRNNQGTFPYLIQFSDFAEPGTLPAEWVATAENSAGDLDIPEGLDEIVSGQVFKNILLVRKRNSVYRFEFVGGNDVWRRRTVSEDVSILNKHCVVTTDLFQLAVSENDIYITEGQVHKSVVKGKTKDWFFKNLNRLERDKAFVLHHVEEDEIWFLAPLFGAEFCNMALIWNYVENTFTLRQCENFLAGVSASGLTPDGFVSWDDLATLSWDEWEDLWGVDPATFQRRLFFVHFESEGELSSNFIRRVLAGRGLGSFMEFNEATVERMHVPLPRGDVVDWDSWKQVSFITPKVQASDEDFYLDIEFGVQDTLDDPIRWYGPKRWRYGKKKIAFDRSGRFVSLRFRMPTEAAFRLTGYDIEYKLVSRR